MPGPKPILNPFQDNLEPVDNFIISCNKVFGYLYTRTPDRTYICKLCANSNNTERIVGHGFTEGVPSIFNCVICDKSIYQTQPIANCSNCLVARERILRHLEEANIPRRNIKILVYDTDNREITYLSYLKPPTYEIVRGVSLNRLVYEQRRDANQ